MTLFMFTHTVLRRLRPLTRTSGAGLFPRLQAVSIVSVTRVTIERKPRVLAKALIPPLNEPTANQKLQYLSFYFREDNQRADVAYTFAILKGDDWIEALDSFGLRLARENSSEYIDAFRIYVKRLQKGEILLPHLGKPQYRAGSNTRREPTAPVREILLPGKARDEEIQLRLQQGQSFLDVGSSLRKTAKFIAQEADRILGKDEVERLLRQRKRGQWSSNETQQLTALRQQKLPLKTITIWLRRAKLDVEKKSQELKSTWSGPDAVEGPQEMLPGLQVSLFNTRLAEIWKALLKSDMTQAWREALQEKSADEWLSSISLGISEDVKKVLGGLRPPTWEELESLPLIDTNNAGVYARLVTSRHKIQMVSDRYLYVGSASRYGGGLNLRIAEHTRKVKRKYESRFQYDIRTKALRGSGCFITLMVMKMDSSRNEIVLDVRRTVTLAEAILTVWLSALQAPAHDLQCVCPWDPELFQYTGWSSHNPLLDDIVLPISSRTS